MRKVPDKRGGFTLIEVLFAIGIAAIAICGILGVYTSCLVLMATSKNVNITTNAALGVVEQVRSFSNPCILNATIPFAQVANNFDCASAIPGYNGFNFTVNDIPTSRGVVYVTNTDPELLEVTVSVCWRQGNRVIGEDTNLNGVLNAGEDTNGNGIIDSTVQLVTRIVNR